MSVSISINDVTVTPSAEVQTLGVDSRFIVVRLGEDSTLIAPGFNGECVRYARLLAATLLTAADEAEQAPGEPAAATEF